MKRAGYREGVAWIAANDEAGEMDESVLVGFVSVAMLADLFGVEAERVAADVVRARKRAEKETQA